MSFQRLLIAFVCVYAAGSSALAQEQLTLADATARALTKNHSIRIEREDVAAAESRMVAARGDYDRQLRIDVATTHVSDPVTSIFSGAPAGSVAPTRTGFESTASVSQLFKSGAVATVSTSVTREGTNSALVLFDPAYTTSLGVDLRQPLLRNRAIDPSRAALRVTALDRDRSGAALARQVLQTVAEVESAYWQLVAARRDLAVRRGTVALAERQRAEIQVRIQGGTVPGTELAQPTAELERRRGEQLLAQEAVGRAERGLKALILGDPADPLWSVEVSPLDVPATLASAVELPRALSEAERYRPEIAELTATISQGDVRVSLARDALKPQLDFVAGYTVRGLAGAPSSWTMPFGGVSTPFPTSLEGALPSSWRSLVDQDFHDALVAVRFEMPLGNNAARGQLASAEASRRRTQTAFSETRERIGVEVRNAVTALETAAGRIQAARASLAAAETQLQAEQDRFEAGLTTTFFVLTRQNELAQAQLTEIAALTAYRNALTEIGRTTGTLLRDRGIKVQ